MKRGDYVVAVDNQDQTEPSWDIGIVIRGWEAWRKVEVHWLIADETYQELRGDIREATAQEYEYARTEKGIDQ